MRWREKTRTAHVARHIYRLFHERKAKRGKQPLLEAKWFLSQLKGSKVTIIKARQALGITSRKIAGRFCWFFPHIKERTQRQDGKTRLCVVPDDEILRRALKIIGKGSTATMYRVQGETHEADIAAYTKMLTEVFEANHYQLTSKRALEEMKRAGFPATRYLYPAKKRLDVKKFRAEDGQWCWVWAGPAVEDWLTEIISKGPISVETMVSLAEKQMGWSYAVLRDARSNLGIETIREKRLKGKRYWEDALHGSRGDKRGDVDTTFFELDEPEKPATDYIPENELDRELRLQQLRRTARKTHDNRDLNRFLELMKQNPIKPKPSKPIEHKVRIDDLEIII